LEFVVRNEYFRNRQSGWIEWDPAACAAVERECAALGRPGTFAQWWDTVTAYDWTTDELGGRLRSRVGRHRRDSGDHRAFGGYGGDYGTPGTTLAATVAASAPASDERTGAAGVVGGGD
jgi:hypothetical protein